MNLPLISGWQGLAQGPTCNQPSRTGHLIAARPFSVVPTSCSSVRRLALIRSLCSGSGSDGGAEERDEVNSQLEPVNEAAPIQKRQTSAAISNAFADKDYQTAIGLIEEEFPWVQNDAKKELLELHNSALEMQLKATNNHDESVKLLNSHLTLLGKQLNLADNGEERVKVLNSQLDLLPKLLELLNEEGGVKVLDSHLTLLGKQLNLADNDEERVKVLNSQLDLLTKKLKLVANEKDRVNVLNDKLSLFRSMPQAILAEKFLFAKMDVLSELICLDTASKSALELELKVAQNIVAGQAPAGKEVLESPTEFESFLHAKHLQPTTHSDRLSQRLCLTQPRYFDISERDDALIRLFGVWFRRFTTLLDDSPGTPRAGKTSIPHVVVPSSPGMGKSRFLDVVASTADSNLGDWNCKSAAISKFEALDANRQVFCKHLIEGVGVSATFNTISDRRLDVELIPDPERALAARLLWGHFSRNDKRSFKDFAQAMANLSCGPPTLQKALELLLADAGGRHIILCVDELLLVDPANEANVVSPSVENLLSQLAIVLETQPSVHVVVSSLSALPVMNWRSNSQRDIFWVGLSHLSYDASLRLLSSALEGKPCALLEQLSLDCGGHPRLVENVASLLVERATLPPYSGVQEFLFNAGDMTVAKKFGIQITADPRMVLNALSMALSARRYNPRAISKFALAGLLLQSPILTEEGEDMHPKIPALLLGIWFVHLDKQVGLKYPKTRIRQLLMSCYQFLHADIMQGRAAEVGHRFETQVAHLLRIRLLLLNEPETGVQATTFTLTDLLSVDGEVNLRRWWTNGTAPLYGLPVNPEWEVKVLRDDTLESLLSGQPPPAGAIYVAARDNYEGVDLFIHPPSGGAITVSVRWAGPESTKELYRTPLTRSINKTKKHDGITPFVTAYVMFSYQNPLNTPWGDVFEENLWPECAQAVVLPREDVEKLIPDCFKCRPCFSDRSSNAGRDDK